MKKIYPHIFLMFVAFIVLSPLFWVFFASFTEHTQAPFLIERVFSPETINSKIDKNILTITYKMRDLIGSKGEQGKKGEQVFTFGTDLANNFILININSYDLKMEYEAFPTPFDFNQNPGKKWLIYMKLDQNGYIVKNSYKINNTSLLTFFNILTLKLNAKLC